MGKSVNCPTTLKTYLMICESSLFFAVLEGLAFAYQLAKCLEVWGKIPCLQSFWLTDKGPYRTSM